MARSLTTDLNNEFLAGLFSIVLFCKLEWDSGDLYVWSGYGDISWDGQTWTGLGHLAGISAIQETPDIIASGVQMQLSGIPSSLIALALGQARQGNEVSIWLGAMSASGSIVADPYLIFSGLMDVPSILEQGDTSTINITAENRLIELNRIHEVRHTDRYQRQRFSGDKGFEYVASLQDKPINWGIPDPAKPSSGGSGFGGSKSGSSKRPF